MRVVVAPDKFAGTLTAVEAAHAIVEGWSRQAPHDELVAVPMADGGPGFLEVLQDALHGELHEVSVPDPYGQDVSASVLLVGGTAYVESAMAVGLALTPEDRRDPERASTVGLGELLRHAVGTGARRVVVGLGGSGTNDGGAGVLHALGARCHGGRLDQGPAGLAGIGEVDLGPARDAMAGVELVVASDVESTLTGLFGATKVFGPQKGLAEERLPVVDGWLQELAAATDRRVGAAKGAGAAGGIGFALLLLGAERVPGVDLVADAVGLGEAVGRGDLVVTGEGAFDFSSRAGKVPYGVAQVATAGAVPCVALAGRVLLGAREMRTLGIESAYSLVELVGERRALDDPAAALAELAARTARTWSPAPR